MINFDIRFEPPGGRILSSQDTANGLRFLLGTVFPSWLKSRWVASRIGRIEGKTL